MAFEYVKGEGYAVDREVGDRVTLQGGYTDIFGLLERTYESPGLPPLRFFIAGRPSKDPGKERIDEAILADISSLRAEYEQALKEVGSEGAPTFEEVKARVADGLFELESNGRHYLKWSPDFHVEWVGNLVEVIGP